MSILASSPLRVGILGAAGYTGIELVRLLSRHEHVQIVALAAERNAGKVLADIFSQCALLPNLPTLTTTQQVDFTQLDVLFGAVPHGVMQALVPTLPPALKIIDLSADFRLRDVQAYQQYYGHAHAAPQWQPQAVFGLPEYYRQHIANARLVANTGCYVAASLLALLPLVAHLDPQHIVINAASGVSGAGRTAKESNLFTEVSEGFGAYGVGSGHRHIAEIDQELSAAAGRSVQAVFTPHLLPQNRGILATITAQSHTHSAAQLHALLQQRYASEEFVHVLPLGQVPQTRYVRGSNYAMIGIVADRNNKVVVVSAIDNLVRGASGQAVQNMNIMCGLPETAGLLQLPLMP